MLHLTSLDLKKDKVETLAIGECEDKSIHTDPAVNAIIKKAKTLKEFSAKKGETVTLYDPAGINAKRAIVRGLGKYKKINLEDLRSFAGKTVKQCIQKELVNVWIAVPDADKINLDIHSVLEAMQEGAYLGNHLFNKYKGEKKKKVLKKICFVVPPVVAKKFSRLTSSVVAVCKSTLLAREWISTPSNEKTPEKLARSMVNLAKKEGLKIQVINEKQLNQKKFGAMLAVSAGSLSKPSLVVLEHKPAGAKKTIALIGKGVTFDSGGLNIKTGGSMSDMKSDMSGGAAVAATMIAVAKLKPKINVIGAIPLVENMPSGTATRPGDIIRSYAGKTVEIGNTDAEGRLILIDAMSYVVKKYKPQTMVDLATLTGACVVALGEKIAAVFSNNDQLAGAIVAAGEKTHERCWHMPLPDDYKELLKSDFADMNNISGTRWGGAITAALFLSEFVGDTRWAHIDIAGPAYAKKENAYCGPGGTGFGVRLLCDLIDKIVVMDKIQLIFFFISGFLVSRLIIKVKLPHRIVYWFIGKRHLSITKILLYLIALSAALSFFIPNAITVLTLLPLLELLRRSYEKSNGPSRRISTMLALATIYGANIGGMGSVTATPANGILVTFAVLENVPGTKYLSFASWLLWGIPLVIIFVGIAWIVLVSVLRPWKFKANTIQLPFLAEEVYHPFQKIALWLTAFYFLSSFLLSLVLMTFSDHTVLILIISAIISLLFILFLFFCPVAGSDNRAPRQVLLKIPDCYNELPMKGFMFVAIAVVLAGILYVLRVHEFFPGWVRLIIPAQMSMFFLLFIVALATSFSTEILSNTAVQVSFFLMALTLADAMGFSGMALLLLITLSCTCAFMSPIATGVNGLAFGGVKGVSFRQMLGVGFIMNIAGALLISIWTIFVVGRMYGLN